MGVEREWPVFWPEFDLASLQPGDPEWQKAWLRLGLMSGDRGLGEGPCESEESWEYLCSVRYPDDPEMGWLHEFRHAFHPRLRRRWVLHVPASPGWEPARLNAPEAQHA